MQIYQMIPTIAYGDAVSNDTIALQSVIKEMGYTTRIYADSIVAPYDHRTALPVEKLQSVQPDDIIIYHLSTGNQLNFKVAEYPCRKIMIYHNITPPQFFDGNDQFFKGISEYALEGAEFLKDKVDYCIADSEFNKQDLIAMGYQCPIDVLPIVIPLKDYEKKPSRSAMKDYKDGKTNILFTGRIAPNKKQEDVIAAFYYYQKLYNPNSRLILAGSYKPTDVYYQRLARYVKKLGLKDVIITGHKKFNHIIAAYKSADLFLCMSEHEGFCVPLVESMIYKVPILAYASTAIPGTLNGSGFLLEDKDPVLAAGCMDRIIKDKQLRQSMIEKQTERLADFEYERIAEMFRGYLEGYLNKKKD